MKYLVSRWHLGLCKHAITLVMWRAPRISHNPGSGAPGALDYTRPSSGQKGSCLLSWHWRSGGRMFPPKAPLNGFIYSRSCPLAAYVS